MHESIEAPLIDQLHRNVEVQHFDLPVGTLLYEDSISTLNSNLLFVGAYRSPIFGQIQSTGVASLRQRDLSDIINHSVDNYDSMVFEIVVEYIYGKRRGSVPTNIYPLKEQLSPGKSYISKDEPIYDTETEVLSVVLDPSDQLSDSIRVHANKAWADDFFMQISGEENIKFLLNYPGFVIQSEATAERILGLNVEGTTLTVYYKEDPENADTQQHKVFDLSNIRYNYYESDRSGSALSASKRGEVFFSEAYAYAQGASGFFCAIDLSPVQHFYNQHKNLSIHLATLSVAKLKDESDEEQLLLPPSVLRLSLPYPELEDLRNHSKGIISRLIANEDARLPNGSSYLHLSDSLAGYLAQVATSLEDELSADRLRPFWVLSALDYDKFEPIILSPAEVRLSLYYTVQ